MKIIALILAVVAVAVYFGLRELFKYINEATDAEMDS